MVPVVFATTMCMQTGNVPPSDAAPDIVCTDAGACCYDPDAKVITCGPVAPDAGICTGVSALGAASFNDTGPQWSCGL